MGILELIVYINPRKSLDDHILFESQRTLYLLKNVIGSRAMAF